MLPARNGPELQLRTDVVDAAREGRFHVWAVATIEEGLSVLTGRRTGERGRDGAYEPDTVFARAEARLRTLVEGVARYGPADLGLPEA